MKKIVLSAAFLLACCHSALAAEASQAIPFAQQAGMIAGVAQACGQDVSQLVARASEVIAIMATSDNEKSAALSVLAKSQQEGNAQETASHKIACNKVIEDYKNLPIMQADYKQTVLSAVTLAAPPAAAQQPPAPAASQSQGVAVTSSGTTQQPQPPAQQAVTNASPSNSVPSNSVLTNNPVYQPTVNYQNNPVLRNNPVFHDNTAGVKNNMSAVSANPATMATGGSVPAPAVSGTQPAQNTFPNANGSQ